jgi:Temperature dependent protein affecting M2 dsRNA replication
MPRRSAIDRITGIWVISESTSMPILVCLADLLTFTSRLPFLYDPDVALGIAVKTYLDDVSPNDTPQERAARRVTFPVTYVPFALAFAEDIDIAYNFFDAIHAGVKALDTKDISAGDRATWAKAAKYLELRR